MTPELAKTLSGVVASFAKSDKPLESFGVGSLRLLPGYEGKVKELAFQQLDANSGVGKVTRNQTINIPDEKGNPVPTVVAYAGKDFPVVLNLVMEDGRTISVNALKQTPMSTIDGEQATKLVAKDWAALVGKSFKLEDAGDDDKTIIRRPNTSNNNALEPRSARFFTVVTA